jgi:2,3-bisphosphoglycerate-dependent phosphoglycerate mutase
VTVHVVFETHSLSVDNERGIATGWLDGTLSEEGRRLARELGARRRDEVDVAFTSDLGRAVETAALAFEGSHVPVHRDARLRECDYGDLNGAPVERVHGERRRRIDEPYPGGESWRAALDRVDGFLDELAARWDGRRVLVLGHVATRWAFDRRVHGRTLEQLVDADFAWREGWRYELGAAGRHRDGRRRPGPRVEP